MWFRKQGPRILAADSCHVTFKGQAVYVFIYLCYSLSDSSLAITFATFLWQNVRVCHPNVANLFGALLRVCTNILFCLSSAKCWFCSLVPIVKCAHRRHDDLACLSVANNTKTWDFIVGNTHILQWDLISKINILRSSDKKCLYIHVVVLLTCVPSLDGKIERFVTKKWQKWLPNSSQTDYNINKWRYILLGP